MDSYTFFKELPISIAVPVLATWLETEDLSRLDVAFCSHAQRSSFLFLLCDDGFTTQGIDHIPRNMEDNYFRWLCTRQVKVRSVTIRDARTYLLMTEERDLLPLCKRLSCLELSSHWYNRDSAASSCPVLLQRMMDLVSCCSHLKDLQICNCDVITGAMVQHLAVTCPLLEHLDLSYSSRITSIDLDVSSRICAFEKLQLLDLNNCSKLDSSSIAHFASHCKNLQILNLSGCHELNDGSIQQILDCCPHLEHLNVRYCRKLTDATIDKIREVGVLRGALRHLNIGGCLQVSDVAMIDLVERLGTYLETLEVVGCSALSDKFMNAAAEYCLSLKLLNIANCSLVSTAGAMRVLECCPELHTLNANFCRHIREADMMKMELLLAENNRSVKIFMERI